MALATVALVKELGGLNESSDYLLFRHSSPDEMDALLTRKIRVASAWLRSQIPAVYASTDADTITLLTEGEAYLALHYACAPLKARKVFGTHWALDQEDSSRFAELIDVEWKSLAQDLLGDFLTVTAETQAFARPTLTVGPVIDALTDSTIEGADLELAEVAEEARGWVTQQVVTP